MNRFEAKNIHIASEYLQNKLNIFKQVERKESSSKNIYTVEKRRESLFKRFINSLFKY
ncbi:MAG: hypothetical protein NTZ60_11110 [Campylobacterales bacterium]|nr:hypothetical protein [Campylobacterales bacterium]